MRDMKREGLRPDVVDYTAVVDGFVRAGKIDEVRFACA